MSEKFIGIDYSYTSPAICILGNDFRSSTFYFSNANKKLSSARNYHANLIEKTWSDPIDRYERLAQWAIESIRPHFNQTTKIILEGYAYGARSGLAFNIAENGGILKYHLKKEFGIYPTIVSPTQVKKFYTGKGNANKELMVETLKEKEELDIVDWLGMKKLDSPAHDMVDSYAIALMGKEDFKNKEVHS